MDRDIVYFDLETQRTSNDVGGWENISKMGMSVGVTYSTRLGEYRIYPESKVLDLVEQLRRADLVVGYNILHFDYRVLMGYTIFDLPSECRSLDMILTVEEQLGHKLKLESLGQGCLGVGKTAEGMDALKWWKEGRIADIAEYCCYDVKVTMRVHEFGVQNKKCFYLDKFNQKKAFSVDW